MPANAMKFAEKAEGLGIKAFRCRKIAFAVFV